MGRIEGLAKQYSKFISLPWQQNLAGDQKTIFVVYPPAEERRLRARMDLFELETRSAKHGWHTFDFTCCFSQWMSSMEYREAYFEEPETLEVKLRSNFPKYAASELQKALVNPDVDENSIVAVYGVAGLYGFTKISLVLKEVIHEIRGRLVLFFPGEYDNNNYRLLGARDGWNYLAVPITLNNGADNL